MNLRLENKDCMEIMSEYPDKYFDLAVIDVPYGIGEANEKRMLSRHHTQKKYKAGNWDKDSPSKEYFNELFRISKNQIIWGANHFISKIPYDSSCWIFWDKDRYGDFADGELAWCSFSTAVRKFKYTWDGFRKEQPEERFHPTQKPIELYKWLLKNYAKPEMKIIDTHLGSGSSLIAADSFGIAEFVGCELDKDYFEAMMKRYNTYKSQLRIF